MTVDDSEPTDMYDCSSTIDPHDIITCASGSGWLPGISVPVFARPTDGSKDLLNKPYVT